MYYWELPGVLGRLAAFLTAPREPSAARAGVA
ncbi:hypothetical protein RKD41_000557 [Streptomyces tendae]